MLNHALKYLRMGLSVIPLTLKGKEPLIPWKEFQQRKATEQEVMEWFTQHPNANIGICTGKISNVCVIDLDGPEGMTSANTLRIKSNTISLSGHGKHLWYKYPKEGIGNSVRQYPGIDIRGESGYIVAPPSIHPSGLRYRWIGALSVTALQDFPTKIFVKTANLIDSPKEQGWISQALKEMKDGNIDNTLVSILGRMRRDGWSSSDARTILQPHAEKVGAESGHLEAKIENIWNRYECKQISNTRELSGNLVIHSPTNQDSINGYESRCKLDTEDGQDTIKTGFKKLDEMFKGGLKSSRLFTVAARTGTGKTNWIIGVSKYLCEQGKRVLLFSTEMPYAEIWQRYIATLSAPTGFKEHKFFVCDSFAPNLEKVEEAINEIKPDLFIFDHINHVSEEQREIAQFMQGLNFLRRKYDVAGIITAQLNRSADWVDLKTGEKVTPRMSMIKGSGTIEQASSRVLLLSEVRVTPECVEIVGNIDKNDNGQKGLVHFGLFNKPYWHIREL